MQRRKPVTFQRRHFEFIAATIRNLPTGSNGYMHVVAPAFAKALIATNPQFNVERFLAACDGVPYKRRNRPGKKNKPVVINTSDFSLAEIKKAERLIDKMEG